jgi:hypothetical protein
VYARISLDTIYSTALTVTGSQTAEAKLSLRSGQENRSQATTLAPADAAVVNYIDNLLDNPAVSGVALEITWKLLNPGNPGSDPSNPPAGTYNWNPLNDVFTAVTDWNAANPTARPKTIQLLILPGFNSPGWVFSDIDASICGTYAVSGSAQRARAELFSRHAGRARVGHNSDGGRRPLGLQLCADELCADIRQRHSLRRRLGRVLLQGTRRQPCQRHPARSLCLPDRTV